VVQPITSSRWRIPRGGSSYPTGNEQQQQQPQDDYPAYADQESFQDRIDQWKRMQQESQSQLSPEQARNPRDEQGRMKLLTSVGKGSRAAIFFFLMWRDIHLYEVAEHALKGKGALRLMVVLPLMILFVGNLAGLVVSLTSPSNASKKRLKAILNLDKLVEFLLIIFSFGRLTVFPSHHTPREIYIANTVHSVFFILQSQAYTRLSWDEYQAKSVTGPVGSMPASSSFSDEAYPESSSYRSERDDYSTGHADQSYSSYDQQEQEEWQQQSTNNDYSSYQ